MLTRSTQVGEFYVLGPPTKTPATTETGFMDILIYDEESDRHIRVTWEDAMKACCVAVAGTGSAVTAGDLAATGLGLAAGTFGTDATAAAALGSGVAGYDVGGETSAAWLTKALAWNVANKSDTAAAPALSTAVYIVVARPFIEHLMHSAVVAVAGRDTGATLFGPADMCAAPPGTGLERLRNTKADM